jgi:large subunit ribosomal protein L4
MPTATLYTKTGAEAGTVELPEALFGAEVNPGLLHQAVTAQLAGRRTGTHDTKTRGEVRGGGHKPYRQKGTGRARQGSRRSPHYAGGGVVFGPHPRDHAQRLPKKMRRAALKGALSSKFSDGAIRIIQELGLEQARTKDLRDVLDALAAAGRILVVAPDHDELLILSARNLPGVEVIRADSLNTVAILNADVLLITEPAIEAMTEVFG